MSQNYTPGIKRIAQVGLVSKGLVYIIFGVLIIMAVFDDGEKYIRLFGILKYIITLGTFDRILVMLLALGLLCYAVWKLLQMVLNTEGCKNNLYGYFIRITWLGPFVFYLLLGGHAILQLYKWYAGTFQYDVESESIAKLVYSDTGRWFIAFLALGLFINAISLFYLSLSGKYKIMLTGVNFYTYRPKLAKAMGFIGYFLYGLALLIISFLFALSLFMVNDAMARGGASMFDFLKSGPIGVALLVAIAIGTVCYGLYFLLASFYRWREVGED